MHGFYSFWDGPGLRAGVGAADFLHVRHPIPQSRFASAGGCKPRPRPCGLLANQGRAAVSRSIGPAGVGGSPAVVRVVGKQGWPGASRSGATRARVCRIKRVSVCPAVGRAVGCRYGCRPARKRRCGRMPGPPSAGCLVCRDMRGSVTRTASSACRKGTLAAGAGALPCLPAKMKGAPKGSLPHQKLTLKNYPLFGRPP